MIEATASIPAAIAVSASSTRSPALLASGLIGVAFCNTADQSKVATGKTENDDR